MSRINWPFLGALLLMPLVPLLVAQSSLDPRLVAAFIGSVALGGLMWRLISLYPDTPALARAAVMLIILMLIITAVGQVQISSRHVANTIATYPIVGHRVGCLLLVFYYRRLLGIGRAYPLKAGFGVKR